MKRKFNKEEMMLAGKSIEYKKQEEEWLEYQLSYYDLMLGKGLEMNHKKNVRDFKQKKKEFEGELEATKNVINILTEQMRNGVEIKETKEENKKEDK